MDERKKNHTNPLFLHAYGAGFTVLGQIKSLGVRRITYEFIDCGEDHPREVMADLFSSDQGLYLTSLPCILVEEHLSEIGSPLSTLAMKRCELELQRLTWEEERKLLEYLKNDYLSRVREITETRRAAPKPPAVRKTGHIKARSFFSLMQQDAQAV